MIKPKQRNATLKLWLSKSWVQCLVATIVFFTVSWLFMGNAINNCSTSSTAMGSDSTGGFAWIQWAGGNDLSWGHTDRSNYPFGETLGKPLYVTSSILIFIYKVLSAISTPVCGINLLILLGYMSTGLVMFGLIKWLLKRFDIALFAGFAAAFVPFHEIKSQSHINYVYGSIFIGLIWAYLWFMSKPSYRRAIILGIVSSIGYYFDGYFVFISSVLIAGLFSSSFVLDFAHILFRKQRARDIYQRAIKRLKYLLVAVLTLAVLLFPILIVYKTNGPEIRQSLATVRSDIKAETLIYGVRPIEFFLPSYNNKFLQHNYPNWRAKKLHGSNFSESTMYLGYTVILLAIASCVYLFSRKKRAIKIRNITYSNLVFTTVFGFAVCLMLAIPATVYIFGHHIPTPVDIFVKLTANWRVLSRLFLAMDPLAIVAASLGLYLLTKDRSRNLRVGIVMVCGLVLFLEYLPSPLHPTSDLYKNAPAIYQKLQGDNGVKLVAEYPLADFSYTAGIFTYQPMHKKTLVNSNDGAISRGPFDASIAGLNDPQSLGALKTLGVDVIVTHGFKPVNNGLDDYFIPPPSLNGDGSVNALATMRSYKMSSGVIARDHLLVIEKGYDNLSVDPQQISHRIITDKATLKVLAIRNAVSKPSYNMSLSINSTCPTEAQVSIRQAGKTIWQGTVGQLPVPINLDVSPEVLTLKTSFCTVDVTRMSGY